MSLHHMLRAAAGYQAPAPATTDPQFNYVSLLLHGDGTNGAQNNTFIDSSTNNFTITRNGNTTQGSLSPYGNLWSNWFNGSTGWLTIPHNTALDFGTGDFTVEAWFNVSSVANSPGIVAKWGAGADNWLIRLETNNTIRFFYIGGSIATTQTVALNTWTHVAVSRASGSCRVFVNGVQTGSTTTVTANLTNTAANASVGAYGAGNNFFPGNISNVRVVKGTALYTSNFTPSTTPLTAVSGTSLLTCQSNRFRDNSANNFTITRNGDVQVTKESPFLPTAAYSTSTIGGSGYFDGTGDYLSFANSAAFAFGTGDFTVEYWIYSNSFANTPTVVDNRSGVTSTNGYADYFNTTGTFALYIGNTTIYTSASAIPTKTWAHIAVSRSGTSLRVFINGTQSGATVTNSTNLSDQFLLVGTNSGATNSFNGYVANLRLVKGTAVYTTNFTPPTAPVTAITNTSLLLNFTNAGIFDNAAENDMETVGNAQISTSVKKYGTGSVAFDGTGDWLLVPDGINLRLGTGNFTVEAWVYLSATGSARGLMGKGTSTTGWLLSTNSSDQVVFTYGSTTLTSSSALSANTWTHVAVVREGTGTNQTKIYIGGSLVATGTVATDFNQTNPMYIGADRTGGSALNGYIDDLRITKGFARYTSAFTPPTAAFPDQ